jgi:hypothetical protein
MNKTCLLTLAVAGALLINHSHAATNYAARIIQYDPGINFAPGFTNTDAVLGEPSRMNPFGEATDPFNPPYGRGQVLSIGEGGSLTIKFDRPIFNTPRKPGRLDFIIYGNSGFIITNDFDPMTFEWIGTPATDGSLFGANPGVTHVSVSMDGVNFLLLDTNRAPIVDGLFPTEGSGDFDIPVNPALTESAFAGATLDDIRTLYHGAAGGTGYDINWTRTRNGHPFFLPWIRYVKVEVESGKTEIDAFSAVARTTRYAK